ncbi:MAG: type ISP restriction/modification enzyme [Saprospiraceae bacterium]
MSKQLINNYYNQVHQIRRSGATNEGALSMPFFFLIMQYAQAKKYQFHSQITIKSTKTGRNIRPDGILMNDLRVHRGYWESKDEDDKIDEEINKKLHKDGYPASNILFEDTRTIVLIQGGEEVMRGEVNDANKLHEILTAFVNYQPAEVRKFEEALEAFKDDIPAIVKTFRDLFDEQSKTNKKYIQARDRFLELCKTEINPNITSADIREMLIQHILTEDLFTAIFDDASFLRSNIIARELESLINTVLTRNVRKNKLGDIRHYYQVLNATAASIADHNEKQKFLKTVYENFYKVYNPKGADRLGVVYTPNEIVRFMVESTDYLLEKHFNKNLHDKGVEILDPATGTGTFITDIIDYIPPQYLPYKYKNELHANEVSILPYYIANLNIEYTYNNKMGNYAEFENICFVDTLDNTDALKWKGGKQGFGVQQSLFGVSGENAERIKRQNKRPISVIIGNPPYNANQLNFNDFNKNRTYDLIDERIKQTFVKQSTAQKTKVYDMYSRFYRWAMDRIDKTQGVVCMITNSSFIHKKTFDGFRKCIQEEYDYAYIVDLGGDIRELSGKDGIFLGEEHTVFGLGAMVGIAVMFLVKTNTKEDKQPCQIRYIHPCDIRATRVEKFEWIKSTPFRNIPFELIQPSKNNYWIYDKNGFDNLLPLIDKGLKAGKHGNAIFNLYSLGVSTNRDIWVIDNNEKHLNNKMEYFINEFNNITEIKNSTIKWSSTLKQRFLARKFEKFNRKSITKLIFRPFTKKYLYYSEFYIDRPGQISSIIRNDEENFLIGIVNEPQIPFVVLSTNVIPNMHVGGRQTQFISLYRYDKNGNRIENLTDWGKAQFTTHYKDETITKEAIFHYTYAVLHNPAYRKKYELNLKREFPRLPFYKDFWKWSAIGKELMDLHLDYEKVAKYKLKRINKKVAKKPIDLFANKSSGDSKSPDDLASTSKGKVKVKLKADKETGIIYIDDNTRLEGVPDIAWTYKLGNRSALEWILDQYKEKKPRDKTIAEKFNTYRFADYKETVIDLLKRVCTVSVRTMEIVGKMED